MALIGNSSFGFCLLAKVRVYGFAERHMSDIADMALEVRQGTSFMLGEHNWGLIPDNGVVKFMNARKNGSTNVDALSLIFKLDQKVLEDSAHMERHFFLEY